MPSPSVLIPDHINYIGVFLTLGCNLNCSYCINDPVQSGDRSKAFSVRSSTHLPHEHWAYGLNRLVGSDVPLTIQGGEPTLYYGPERSSNFYSLVRELDSRLSLDLLTNLQFDPGVFSQELGEKALFFKREAPYPSIRVSYHHEEMTKKSGGLEAIVQKCQNFSQFGFRVAPQKAQSDVGIYMVEHPENTHIFKKSQEYSLEQGIPFEGKPFLGIDETGRLHGVYKYPFSTILPPTQLLECECRTTEILIAPSGFIYRCHHDLYESEQKGRLQVPTPLEPGFSFKHFMDTHRDLFKYPPVSHILAEDLSFSHEFRSCSTFGACIGCDTKVKNNRFQSLEDHGEVHTSLEIRNVPYPTELANISEQEWLNRASRSK